MSIPPNPDTRRRAAKRRAKRGDWFRDGRVCRICRCDLYEDEPGYDCPDCLSARARCHANNANIHLAGLPLRERFARLLRVKTQEARVRREAVQACQAQIDADGRLTWRV